jgi:serine protease Do
MPKSISSLPLRKTRTLFSLSIALTALLLTVHAEAAAPAGGIDFASVAAKVMPAVVSLSVIKLKRTAQGSTQPTQSTERFFGTGFVIDPSGVIVTNRHVIQDAIHIAAAFPNEVTLPARLIAAGALMDIAVLKVDAGWRLPSLRFADSSKVRVAQPVLTIGNPYGLGLSVGSGVISALNRNIMESPFDEDFQTDAPINPGNSGGPMVDAEGEVVGIDTAFYSAPNGGFLGIGYAIPSNDAASVVRLLMEPEHPKPGWIGVQVQDLTPELEDALAFPGNSGTVIAGVEPDSPAARAGLRPGDVIVSVEDTVPPNAHAFLLDIALEPVGDEISLGVWRQGEERSVPVHVAPWPNLRAAAGATIAHARSVVAGPGLGLQLAPLTEALERQSGVSRGLLIQDVSPGSDAAVRDLKPGDVLTEVDGVSVATAADVEARVAAARREGHVYVALLIVGKHGPRWVTVYVGSA